MNADEKKKGRISAALFVELPGIETDALPGNLPTDCRFVPFRFRSVPLITCGYLFGS